MTNEELDRMISESEEKLRAFVTQVNVEHARLAGRLEQLKDLRSAGDAAPQPVEPPKKPRGRPRKVMSSSEAASQTANPSSVDA